MTEREKAERYDALQAAIKFWRDRYAQLSKECMEEAKAFKKISKNEESKIVVYYNAKAAVYDAVCIDMKTWIEDGEE